MMKRTGGAQETKELSIGQDLISAEKAILRFWEDNDIISKCLSANENAQLFRFVEGPPTANGSPGVHHVYARIVKDLFCRYKSMKGYFVPRTSGWDCHGLPVEISVEKELSLDSKQKIEEYGVESFNKTCRYSVFSHIDEWSNMTRRIGFFIDLDNPYTTMDPKYIESVWWSLKLLWEKGLLYESYYVVPYCPRCGTALSSHEVAQGYYTIKEESIYVKFPLIDAEKTYFLAWTTTPWTLLSNVALAVHPNISYVVVEISDERLIFAKDLLDTVTRTISEYRIIDEFKGSTLEGKKYRSLFSSAQSAVVTASFVTTIEGTGIVHVAPAFGEDDFNVAKVYGLPMIQLVGPDGRFNSEIELVGGMFFTEANSVIIAFLEDEGLLFKVEMYEHSYPFCWRCETPLMYYARKAWFVKMSTLRDELMNNNEKINWYPKTIKRGRFGNFIENVRDWALSRERYWGTPLPIWKCPSGHVTVVGSIEELKQKSSGDTPFKGVHKPYIDEVILKCQRCGQPMQRASEVIDCWYDSGCAPFASLHHPFETRGEFKVPVDFISEGIDQTRGWFYSLHAISTAVFGTNAYENVISLGHIVDAQGRKMSKSKGNSVDPWLILNNEGADSLRWYLFSSGPPGNPKKFYEEAVIESQRKFVMTLWNILAFYKTYAEIDCYDPLLQRLSSSQRNEVDRWLISKLNRLIIRVNELMDKYDYNPATLEIEQFVEDMSNWYIRTSRRRFWKIEQDLDKKSAYDTLYETLLTFATLVAPFTPFIAEHIYKSLQKDDGAEAISVHLEPYPTAKDYTETKLEALMDYVREVVEAGRAARATCNIKIRQPLKKLICIGPEIQSDELKTLIKSELNIKQITFRANESDLVAYSVTLNFTSVGPKYKKVVPQIQRALRELDSALVVREIPSGLPIEVDGKKVTLFSEDIVISKKTKDGFAKGTSNSIAVFLETEITPELKKELIVRELVRRIQVMRKDMNLPYTAKIKVGYITSEEIAKAIEDFCYYIKAETLTTEVVRGAVESCKYAKEWMIEGHPITVCICEEKLS
jgi:isoleucyl-tRNA synthetase